MENEFSGTEKAAKLLYSTMVITIIVISIFCIFLTVLFFAGIFKFEFVNKYIADPSLFFGGSLSEFFLMVFLYICDLIFWIIIMCNCLVISKNTIKHGSPYTIGNAILVNFIYKIYSISVVIWYVGIVILLPLFGGVIGLHNLKLSKIAILLVFYFIACIFSKAKDLQLENDEIL